MRHLVILATLVALAAIYPPARAAFPGRDGKIVFTRDDGNGHDLFAVRPGSKPKPLTDTRTATDPVFAAGGKRLAYVCDHQLCVMRFDSKASTQITSTVDGHNHRPAWSPSGRRIVFSRTPITNTSTPEPKLYKIHADGTGETQLTSYVASDPQWSPNARWIVFAKGVGGIDGIFKMHPDGSHVTKLLDHKSPIGHHHYSYFDEPTWSPDGRRIAFLASRRDRYSLIVMRANGSRAHQIFRPVNAQGIAWSPEGTKLILEKHNAQSGLVVVHTDGSESRSLTRGSDSEPDWQPR